MAEKLEYYVDILSGSSQGLSAISALKSLDATVKANDTAIKSLEKNYASAIEKAEKLAAAGDMKGANKAAAEAAKLQTLIGKNAQANASAEAKAGQVAATALKSQTALANAKATAENKAAAIASKGAAQQAAQQAKANDLSRKQELSATKHSVAMQKLATQQQKLSGATKEAAGAVENAESNWKAMKSALGSGGAVGAAIAVAVAMALAATAVVTTTIALAKYALTASDAARSSQLLSAAATGSGSAAHELETVVDQLSNKIPQTRQKTAEWARELALANIAGRDMQRTLTTMGVVASAVGDSAAGKIKGIAEASRTAQRFMLGARDRFGEFASLSGTGIKAADIYAAVAKSMRTSIPEAKRMVDAGIIPFRRGLEALEQAAETKFGPIVARQMLSLDTQATKLKENIAKLFSGANIEKFLEGLKTVTDLFDTNTATGYVLREVFTSVFTKIADMAALAFPYIRAAILGVAAGVIIFATAAKQLYRQFQETFGGGAKSVDGIQLAFKIGVGLVAALVGSVVALTAAFVLLGTVALIALAPIWVPIAITAAVLYLAIRAISAFIDAFTSIGTTIANIDLSAAAGKVIDGLVKGLKDKIADVKSAMSDIADAITGTFTGEMEIKSPSRKAQRWGGNISQGTAIGIEQEASRVERATMAMVPSAPNNGRTGEPSSGGLRTDKIELHFHGLREDEVAPKVREVVVSLFMGDMRGFAMGVTG